ncbi:MAG: hypothetical protein WBB89_14145 [Candidatus Acidiferrum sp.]
MNRNKALLLFLLLASFSLAACSGPTTVCTVNCGGGGNATVSFTLVADTLPANPSILSFKVTIVGITLTPTTGTAQTFTPNPALVVDLMRLQSDTAFLGTLTNVPSGSYTVQVSLSSPVMTFLNDTGSPITANGVTCPNNSVCTATLTAVGTPTISSFTFNATTSGLQGIEIDFKLNNAISLSSGTLSVNFNPSSPNPGVFTAFTLPRTNANLGTNQLELIEDFTGVVGISGSTVTITSPTRGTLTATSTSNSFFDPSPDGSVCPTPATINCVANNQIASVDAFLNTDGTLSLKEFEPLNATRQDFVEGTVYAVNTPTQFAIAVTDKVQLATNSLIGGLNTGDLLTVNIPAPKPFLVDTKGLAIPAGSLGLFRGQADTSAIHPGQTVAVNVTALVAALGNTIAAATSDTVTLRWSRLIAISTGTSTSTVVDVNSVPSYFNITPASVFPTQVFSGTLGGQGVTNLDGIPSSAANVTASLPVGLRVLYLENSSNSAQFPFMAAKIRQH